MSELNSYKSLKMNKKTLLKLLATRDSVERDIAKRQRYLVKIDREISSFGNWLKSCKREF
jgi:hypothetical protein